MASRCGAPELGVVDSAVEGMASLSRARELGVLGSAPMEGYLCAAWHGETHAAS